MRALFVANGGGHLKELIHLSQRLPFPVDESLWVTFDSPQSRSLLRGQEVRYVRYSSPRDGWATLVNFMAAIRILRRDRFDVAVSTGATVAVSFLPLARLLGTPSHYVESATRSDGPSLTGRLLRWAPGVQLYTQHASWAGGRWRFAGSVFDQFESTTEPDRAAIERVVVTVGASETYSFERLIRGLLPLVPPGADILWQTGCADVEGLGIDARRQVPALELEAAMRDADLVISHAGVGSALSALESGRRPVLVPRERSFGEHVDDHQFQIAEDLGVRNLAVARRVDELRVEDLEEAATSRVRGVGRTAPIAIDPPSWRRRSRRVQRSVASARRGRSVFVAWGAIAGRSHELAEALDADVLSCFPPGTTRRPSAPVRYLLSTVRTVGYLVSRRPRAVIVTNPPIIPALLAVAYARITGRVVVIDDHPGAFGAQGYRIGELMEPLHRRLVPWARLCLVTDQSWVDLIERWGGRGLVLHEAPGDWVPHPARPVGDRPNVLFVCTFAPDEPAVEVMHAAAQLPQVDFTITGDLARAPDVQFGPNVRLVGFLDRSAYRLAVETADVVLTLTTEPTSAMRAAFEAVWAERVLVVNDWTLLQDLFPHAVHVENTADSIALGVRKALEHHDQLVSAASAARQEQLERWEAQISALRDALDDSVPGDRLKGA
jgi:UDP-N-acetylglucosamine--N-acetylmuramyl-(pentapeptide) pyrophosphoryl-undecaprenol N-acetylglucosamine transferase